MATKRVSELDPKDSSVASKKYRQSTLTWAPTLKSLRRTANDDEPFPYFRLCGQKTKPKTAPIAYPSSIPDEDEHSHSVQPNPAAGPPTPFWCRAVRISALGRRHHNPLQAAVALETLGVIPQIFNATPTASPNSILYTEYNSTDPGVCSHWRLHARFSPRLQPTPIRVMNADTLDQATAMIASSPAQAVCILNMANRRLPGGGWLEGATAQEEQLCLRSTLARTLTPQHYPLPLVGCLFSPAVAVFRSAAPDYVLYSNLKREVDVVSVVSAAALDLRGENGKWGAWEREVMRNKMRHVLRVAARREQRRIVLGAFGCGAFRNPPREVATLWKNVFSEPEFMGVGWWAEVVFAIYEGNSGKGDENLKIFRELLEGVEV